MARRSLPASTVRSREKVTCRVTLGIWLSAAEILVARTHGERAITALMRQQETELYDLNLAAAESHSDRRVLRWHETDTLAFQQLINAHCCWPFVLCRLDVAADEC